MRREENKWIKKFQERMEGYSEPVPEDLWISLEKELDKSVFKVVRPYRWMAAAAAVLLVVISSLSLYFLQTPSAQLVKETPVQFPSPETSPVITSVVPPSLSPMVAHVNNAEKRGIKEKKNNISQSAIGEEIFSEEGFSEEKKENEEKKQVIQNTEVKSKKRPAYKKNRYINTGNKAQTEKRKWSMGVAVGNLTASSGDSYGFGNLVSAGRTSDPYTVSSLFEEGGEPVSNNPAAREAYREILLNQLNKEVKTQINHKMPVTFGASARFAISSRFAVETGLTYTLLASDLKTGDDAYYYEKEQKLHYLGIPVKGNWLFLQKKYLTLYLSAGGAMEICVAGKLKTNYITDRERKVEETEDVRVKPLQWSVASAVGAQFNANRYIGIYVEPGIVYYFDDGSSVQTIRKDKPFNFNLQLGIRFTY